jgi:hypothetical protein
MLKLITCLLTFCLTQANELPFWKAKAKIYQRIENREIIVSVHSEKAEKPQLPHDLHAAGGGQVNSPRDFLFSEAKKYGDLSHNSDYVKSSIYHPDTHILELKIEAFGHSSEMNVELKEISSDETRQILFHILSGPFKGFQGTVDFTSLKPKKSEVGFSGEYRYDEFPIPRFFLEFGMEIVLQKMAFRLRKHVEELWRETQSP